MLSKILNQAIIKTDDNYISVFIFIAAILNFLAGITIDMYSPSMPAIAKYFAVSVVSVKATIAISIIGWSFGCVIFGALIDSLGRKTIISFGLLCYTAASFMAVQNQSFTELIILRFIQGVMVSTVTIGCRALIIDCVVGKRYAIAMLYASLAYSCGTIFGPFIGGILQYHFAWQANFVAFGIVSILLLSCTLFVINESLPVKQPLIINVLFSNYITILKNKNFIAGIIVVTLSNIELMLYPTIGPFIVENIMHYSAITYGYTAIIVSIGYLSGALLCRHLLHLTNIKYIYWLAFVILFLAVFIAYVFLFLFAFNLWTLLTPMIMLNMTVGLITPNIMGANLKLFSNMAGLAMSVQVGGWALLTAIGIFIISHISMNSLLHLAILYSVLVIIQWLVFFTVYTQSI